ncbi:MAG: iron-sulfur cluster insertion protein ErpA, partial [Chloroflexota bacterium]
MISVKELAVVQTPPVVTLSAKAAEMVRDILAKEDNDQLALRVYVAGGGCSGLQYGMALDDPSEEDVTLDYDGIRVVVDNESLRFIEGSEIDYVDSLMGAGFTVNNPNAVSSCGCGHSFR